ncbi:TOMM precursor leader peptide-binding protein [Paenibacillus thiaminolyticus]|uniref:TOMM precursor leader peptide-binding protein n=1 Tax=Paenibacillus thiaminolyticus TaxID=49283 RepID=UPI001164D3ED|nr:TOMM precursor leader peptide-binding protein [Paenibacillus thiaminolyticus]NGP59408.1 TOMM precursor leader peptide-binding protein [Paenibacillus thiaminolyticus]
MSAIVTVIGEGQLADFVRKLLSADDRYRLVWQKSIESGETATGDLALVLNDAWDPSVHPAAEERFRQSGTPWLRGFVAFGEGIVGPLVRPEEQGCSQCADTRLLLAGSDRRESWGLQQKLASHGGIARDAWASRTGLLQVAHLVAEEAVKILESVRPETDSRMYLIDLQTLQSSSHFFLPDPLCPICSRLPEDDAQLARITLQPSLKISAKTYRSRSLDELKDVLAQDYLDARTGFLNGQMVDLVSPFADASINLPLFGGDEACAGRTHSYADSEMTAILEGLERYCGLSPRGKRTDVHDSYRNVQDQALDPLRVGVHAKEQYERSSFPFKPFDPERPIDWVWGYSFLQERPILVPELLAYYSAGCGHGFVYETSNGCALGGSLEEAIFYGMLEVVERDSFLMTWYARLPLPRLDLRSVPDRELRWMTDRLEAVAGYDMYLYNSTMEHGIPSVWALAKNKKERGVNLICAAGAHPDPIRAAKSAIHEVAGMLLTVSEKFEENRRQYERMLLDPYQVVQMEDHSMLYGLKQAEERLDFLLNDDRPIQTFAEAFEPKGWNADLTDDLKAMLHVFRQLNLEVIVVDQTTPETRRNGLYCVKVLIPGMLPMTFGQHLIRVTGLDRVLRVPAELSYSPEPLSPEQLNPYPHPFP